MNDYGNGDTAAEERRVARFTQAIERMHHDPAEAARIDLIIEETEGLVVDEENQQIIVHVHNAGEGSVTNIQSGDSRPTGPMKPETLIAHQHTEPGRFADSWPSLLMVPIVIAAVLLSSRFESWSVVGAALPAMALLLMEVARRPFGKKTRVSGSVRIRRFASDKIQASDRELNRR
ncbi:hypothetical protein ABZ593_10495 [Streptomyces sp. NPDC012617]|uniref:hypothetical protein n=1 Tax=Streptomyces TaxID=1883 RepID=UPI0033DC2BC7